MKKLIRFIPAVLWMLVIFYFSSRTTTGVAIVGFNRFLFFKSLHLLEYAVLLILLFFAFRVAGHSFFTGYLYALFDEFHQSFTPGRGPDFTDTLIDLIGMFLGFFLLSYLRHRFSKS